MVLVVVVVVVFRRHISSEYLPTLLIKNITMFSVDPWEINPAWQWWLDAEGEQDILGPLRIEECLCQRCCDYLVCVGVREFNMDNAGRTVWLCHLCAGWVLQGHATAWNVGDIWWTAY